MQNKSTQNNRKNSNNPNAQSAINCAGTQVVNNEGTEVLFSINSDLNASFENFDKQNTKAELKKIEINKDLEGISKLIKANIQSNTKKINPENITQYRRLGNGAMACVYYGRYIIKDDCKDVAIKVPKKNFTYFLEKEYKIYKDINHKNIVKSYGVYYSGKIPKLLLEYCLTGDLYSFVHTKKNKNIKLNNNIQLIKIFHGLALGLEYLHNKKILHRDIKLENCLVTEIGGELIGKISDFGVSAEVNDIKHPKTKLKLAGTYEYLPYNSFLDENYPLAWWDIYAFALSIVSIFKNINTIYFGNDFKGFNHPLSAISLYSKNKFKEYNNNNYSHFKFEQNEQGLKQLINNIMNVFSEGELQRRNYTANKLIQEFNELIKRDIKTNSRNMIVNSLPQKINNLNKQYEKTDSNQFSTYKKEIKFVNLNNNNSLVFNKVAQNKNKINKSKRKHEVSFDKIDKLTNLENEKIGLENSSPNKQTQVTPKFKKAFQKNKNNETNKLILSLSSRQCKRRKLVKVTSPKLSIASIKKVNISKDFRNI